MVSPSGSGALAPLSQPVFRMLWSTWLVANTCMWMHDVAAAWLMTSLAPSPLWVALVQTASTLPVFLLGLPSGALADIVDRRRYFMFTQLWVAVMATLTCLAIVSGVVSAPLLLALTFANGVGLALRWPVFAAIVPELVPRPQLPAALALNGVAMNASRILGPLVAGALIAGAGSAWVFALNAVLSVAAALVILRWRREAPPSTLARERLRSAIRVGVQYVRESPRMRGVLLRIAVFFLHSSGLLALLPVVARGLADGDARSFTMLLAAMGAGAIAGALNIQRIRQRLAPERLLLAGAALQGLCTLLVAHARTEWVAVPAMFVAGVAWIAVANSLTVAAQMALPDWVRARGMSIYQMALMGGSAAGAALWGQTAALVGVPLALSVAAASGLVCMALAQRLMPARHIEEDLTPAQPPGRPALDTPPPEGPVVTQIEYRIDPARMQEFVALMQASRRSRLRQGALDWQLLHDLYDPGRYVEQITDESWTEHLRRFERVTAEDLALRDRKLAMHVGDGPPTITRSRVARP